MAVQWSSETFSAEFRDLQANAMAVDCLGTWALLAGKKVLAFVNLENPDEGESPNGSSVVRVNRQSKWDVSCVQFNPHASHAQLFVTACNQRLDLYKLDDKSGNAVCSLKAHSRMISDIDWSPFDVNVVASCSIDTFTYLWDIRDPKKPVHSFQTVAGAFQVKWNKVTNNLFATTHEGDIRIWDPRKGNTPLQYIAAHLSKIHGLDWSPSSEFHLATAGQDGYVKLWDTNNPRRAEGSLNSLSPVRRARYTPFGAGLVTVVVPQLRRGENTLYLWKVTPENQVQPLHTFVGHKDVVLEFQWRKQPEGVRDQQLVTWSRDQSLRIWRIEPNLQRLCGHDVVDTTDGDLTGTSYNSSESTLKDFRDLALSESGLLDEEMSISSATSGMAQQPQTLQQEFTLLNKNMPNVMVDEMDTINRSCRVTWISGGHKLTVEVAFPLRYPNNVAPVFQILQTSLEGALQNKLLKSLNETAFRLVKRNSSCLEQCLRQMVTVLDCIVDDRRSPESEVSFPRSQQPIVQPTFSLPMYTLGSFQDSTVPFPRTSGARFCSNGKLVAFGVPAQMKKVSGGAEITPKALSELAAFTQTTYRSTSSTSGFGMLFSRSPPTPSTDMSISDFFMPKGKQRVRTGKTPSRHHHRHRPERETVDKSTKKQQSVGKVLVYDVEALIGVSKYLAQHYILDMHDIEGTCRTNANVAAAIGRKDLVQIWTMVSIMSSKSLQPNTNPDAEIPWAMLPMGRRLLREILDRYAQQYDVQTLAMLCCLFWSPDATLRMERSSSKSSLEYMPPNLQSKKGRAGGIEGKYNPYHTVSSVTGLLKGWRSKPSVPLGPTTTTTTNTTTQPPGPSAPPSRPLIGPAKGHMTHHPHGQMSEVASQPNLAALFKAGGGQSVSDTAVTKSKRSLSWSDSYDDFPLFDMKNPQEKLEEKERLQHEDNCKMLDPMLWEQYDRFKLAYARVLYNWQLLNQRSLILKFISTSVPQHRGVEFAVYCHKCRREMRGPQCSWCKYPALQCAICHLGVKGLSNFCLVCSHGGHTSHIMEWFATETVCPTGCGCKCLKENFFSGI